MKLTKIFSVIDIVYAICLILFIIGIVVDYSTTKQLSGFVIAAIILILLFEEIQSLQYKYSYKRLQFETKLNEVTEGCLSVLSSTDEHPTIDITVNTNIGEKVIHMEVINNIKEVNNDRL